MLHPRHLRHSAAQPDQQYEPAVWIVSNLSISSANAMQAVGVQLSSLPLPCLNVSLHGTDASEYFTTLLAVRLNVFDLSQWARAKLCVLLQQIEESRTTTLFLYLSLSKSGASSYTVHFQEMQSIDGQDSYEG